MGLNTDVPKYVAFPANPKNGDIFRRIEYGFGHYCYRDGTWVPISDQCAKCINSYSSMNDEPYLCGIRPCPFVERLIKEAEK